VQADHIHRDPEQELPTAKYDILGDLFVFADKAMDTKAQSIVTEEIEKCVKKFICDSEKEGFVELGVMVAKIWEVAPEEAPIRQLLVDAIFAFQWSTTVNRDVEKSGLTQCFEQLPIDCLAQVAVNLLDHKIPVETWGNSNVIFPASRWKKRT
jgi:hypothetical protein